MACAALECVTAGLAPGLRHLLWPGGGEGSLSLPLCPPPLSPALCFQRGDTPPAGSVSHELTAPSFVQLLWYFLQSLKSLLYWVGDLGLLPY